VEAEEREIIQLDLLVVPEEELYFLGQWELELQTKDLMVELAQLMVAMALVVVVVVLAQ
jgi:hypothetical protein